MQGIHDVDRPAVLIFSVSDGTPSGHLWEDDEWTTHTRFCRGVGGDQGRHGATRALEAVQSPVGRSSLRIWATFTSSHFQRENRRSVWSPSEYTTGDPRPPEGCEVLDRVGGITRPHSVCLAWIRNALLTSRVCRCSALHCITLNSRDPTWRKSGDDHQTVLDRTPMFVFMVAVGALCPRSSLLFGQGWSNRKQQKISVGGMTRRCGGVSVHSCKVVQNNHKKCWTRPRFLWRWEVLGLRGAGPLTGRASATQPSPLCWCESSKDNLTLFLKAASQCRHDLPASWACLAPGAVLTLWDLRTENQELWQQEASV